MNRRSFLAGLAASALAALGWSSRAEAGPSDGDVAEDSSFFYGIVLNDAAHYLAHGHNYQLYLMPYEDGKVRAFVLEPFGPILFDKLYDQNGIEIVMPGTYPLPIG